MTHTETLYLLMRDFTDERRKNRETYLNRKAALHDYQGSKGYTEELAAARKKRDDADNAARAKTAKAINEVFQGMRANVGAIKAAAPTDEQIRLLQVAKMLDHPARGTLDSIANALGGNALALAALSDIAKEAWKDNPDMVRHWNVSYSHMADAELGANEGLKMLKTLEQSCEKIIQANGANMVRERNAGIHERIHGGTHDPDDLPQEEPYTSNRDFYRRTLGLDENGYIQFAVAVNGKSE